MKVLHATNCNIKPLPSDISNLVKLRHLVVEDDTIHSSIVDVGKLKSLQELRRFVVGQHRKGFELWQKGHLEEICSLCIDGLENVEASEEADEAKLMLKSRLHELTLEWNIYWSNDYALEEHVLERLKPSCNLQKLSIIGHKGGTCPSWLGTNLSLSSLKSLCLEHVYWKMFPPIGDLLLVNVPREEISINIPEKRFGNLRRLKLVRLSGLRTWVVHDPCQLFPHLEVLLIEDCSLLVELSISHSAGCCQQGKEVNVNLFPSMKKLKIINCPQLSSFPPVPWTEALCYIRIQRTSSLDTLICEKENSYEYTLSIEGKKDTTDSTFWNVLAFHKLTGVKVLHMYPRNLCQSLPLRYLQMLSSLRTLEMHSFSNTFPFVEADSHVKYQFPVETLDLGVFGASGKEMTQLLTYFPKLSGLVLRHYTSEKLTGLAVNVKGQRATETPGPSSSANINKVEQQQGAREEDDATVASEDVECSLLLLPPQLQELRICDCPELRLCSNPDDDGNQDGRTGGGGGLQGLSSLRRLEINRCPKLLSSYQSSSFPSFPFPNSMQHLNISGAVGLDTLVSLSNLTSLSSLSLCGCEDLSNEGLLSLLAQGHLTRLTVLNMPNFFDDWVHQQELRSCSSKLQGLIIDDVAGFAAASIRRNLLLSSLATLEISKDSKLERFTEQQEALLFVNSLEEIIFESCHNLQSLPERLHRLPNLKRLQIGWCRTIQMWPKNVLPSSLEELDISSCRRIQSLHKDCLPDSLQKLKIFDCPNIQSLPKVDDLPSSLRELDVCFSGSGELNSQCRKLINTIPVVKVDYN